MTAVFSGTTLENVHQFYYVESTADNGKYHTEIKRRIEMGKEAFYTRGDLL